MRAHYPKSSDARLTNVNTAERLAIMRIAFRAGTRGRRSLCDDAETDCVRPLSARVLPASHFPREEIDGGGARPPRVSRGDICPLPLRSWAFRPYSDAMLNNHTVDDQKRAAAEAALEYVKPGMRLGLGTGSTAEHFVRALAARVKAELKLTTVATSERTATLARELGFAVADLNTVRHLDLTVDGADEIGPGLTLIKGGGGALLREKIVASASDRMVVIADAAKLVDTLGRFPLPVEITRFGWQVTMERIAEAAARAGCSQNLMRLRGGEAHPFTTDGGNYIADCAAETIPDPERLAHALEGIPGVVGHGLFVAIASVALVGTQSGVKTVELPRRSR
jgi:ribose 5-phosphate isomerase A